MDQTRAAEHYRSFLLALGLPAGPEVDEAAQRVTELMVAWTATQNAGIPALTLFDAPKPQDWVAVVGIPVYSFCEHHMVPFFGHVDVAYLPGRSVVGFSGIVRLLDHFARRPQIQERLTAQLADALCDAIAPQGLLVTTSVRQLCVELRRLGGQQLCVSEAARGICRESNGRGQALSLLRGHGAGRSDP